MFKDKKGFTLIELLATIVILGIIMVVAVPNVTGIIYKNRANTYVEDAKKLATLADYVIRGGTKDITKPNSDGQCIALSLLYLDNAEFEDPPNGGEYDKENSFVVVKKNGTKLEYYVQLVEKFKDTNYRGVPLTLSSNLNKEGATTDCVSNFESSKLTKLSAASNTLNYVKKFDGTFTCNFVAVYTE